MDFLLWRLVQIPLLPVAQRQVRRYWTVVTILQPAPQLRYFAIS